MREKTFEANSPAVNVMASPWKIGPNKITLAPTTIATAVTPQFTSKQTVFHV
jgi:hypothetical protein